MIKDRVIQLIEYKRIPKEEFYKKIGMTSASFRGNAKQTPLNSNAIENILSEIPDTNPEWLLTGKGEMLIKKEYVFTDGATSVNEPQAGYGKEKECLKDGYVQISEKVLNTLTSKLDQYTYEQKELYEIIKMLREEIKELKNKSQDQNTKTA